MLSSRSLTFLRNLVTSSARLCESDACKDVGTKKKGKKVPALVFGIEGRYATALYNAATKMEQLANVEKEMKCLQQLFKQKPDLYEKVISPAENRKKMAKTLMTSAKKAGMSNAFGNFLSTLASNGRLKRFNGISNAFATIMTADRGDVECEITTAKKLDDKMQEALSGALKKFLKQGQKVKLKMKVDPELIGGMVVKVGDRFVDMSIATKVKMYTDLISQPIEA